MLRASFVFEPGHRVHLGQTLAPLQRGTFDPLFRSVKSAAGQSIWVPVRQGSSCILARFHRAPGAPLDAPVTVTLWSEGSTAKDAGALEAFAAQVPGWLGEQDRWSPFYSSPAWDLLPERLRRIRAQNPGLRLPSVGLLSQNLLLAITEQRVTGIEAMGGMRALLRQYGTPAPATGEADQPEGLLFFPEPAVFAEIPSWAWHRAGFDRSRSETMMRYARQAASFERFAPTAGITELARALATLPGIGPWTIAETLQRYCGHPDAISVGDYHLAHTVTYAFDGVRGEDARMLELLAPFTGHRQRVVSLIKAAGITEPRRGPRLAPQDYRAL